jgi:invasion protein IalB
MQVQYFNRSCFVILRTLAAAAALAVVAASAVAQPMSPPSATLAATPATSPAPKKADANHTVICKTSETTGTRLTGTRVCLTKEQWAERDERTREVMDRTQASPASH